MNSTPAIPGHPSRRAAAWLIALAVVPYFLVLGAPPLWDANEPLYAEPPKEVLEWPEGDFWAPTWNGKPYFAHPPLSTWITVPFYAVLGASEFSERLPMALAAVLTVLAVFQLGCLMGGRRIGLLAALGLTAMPRVWLFSRQLSGDVFFTTILTWAFALTLTAAMRPEAGRARPLWTAWVLLGVGFLAKGPVILVLYAGTVFFTALFAGHRGPWRQLAWWRDGWRLLATGVRRYWPALVVILALGAPWFLYMGVRYRDVDFLGQYFGHYTFGRVVGNIGDRGPLFYLRVLLGDAQPALAVLPFAAWIAWKKGDRAPAAMLPWAGMAWILLFFTLPAGKRNVYLMPMYPLMAVAAAPLMSAVWDGRNKAGVRLGGCAAAFGCFAGALLLYLLWRNAPALGPEIHVTTVLLIVLGIPLLVAGLRGHGRLLAVGSLATVFCLHVAMAVLMPALARYRPIPSFAAQIRQAQDAASPEPALIHAAKIHSLNFYLGRATKVSKDGADLLEKMGSAQSAFVVVQQHDFDAPPRRPGERRRGLANDGTGLVFEEIDRRPELIFRFDRSILGRGETTRDLLLLRATRTGKSGAPGPGQGQDEEQR